MIFKIKVDRYFLPTVLNCGHYLNVHEYFKNDNVNSKPIFLYEILHLFIDCSDLFCM